MFRAFVLGLLAASALSLASAPASAMSAAEAQSWAAELKGCTAAYYLTSQPQMFIKVERAKVTREDALTFDARSASHNTKLRFKRDVGPLSGVFVLDYYENGVQERRWVGSYEGHCEFLQDPKVAKKKP